MLFNRLQVPRAQMRERGWDELDVLLTLVRVYEQENHPVPPPTPIEAISFVMEQGHPADIGFLLDRQGIAIRTGHHCTQPVMDRYNVPATSRASFAMYNTKEEIDILVKGLKKIIRVFG